MKKIVLTIMSVLISTCSIYSDDLTVKIDPAQITLNETETCTLNVVIENVTNLGSFEFFIDYDTGIVHADTVLIGNFLASSGRTLFPVYTAPDNNSNPGTVRYASASLGGTTAPDGPSGTGTLAHIVFTAQESGDTDLNLRDVSLNDGTIDANGISINQLIDSHIKVNSTAVELKNQTLMPETCILKQNSPNPFNPSTIISYSLYKKGSVQLKIYDLLGKCVSTLVDTFQNPGEYQIEWQAKGLSSGVYFCRLTSGESIQTIKLLYLQ